MKEKKWSSWKFQDSIKPPDKVMQKEKTERMDRIIFKVILVKDFSKTGENITYRSKKLSRQQVG